MANLGLFTNTTPKLCMMICFISLVSIDKSYAKNRKRCFDNICLKPGYSRDTPPSSEDGSPIKVDMEFKLSIISVDCDYNIVGLTMSLRQTWMDNRIYSKENGGRLPLPTRMGRNPETGIPQQIWMPKLFFYSLAKMEITTNFQEQSLLWLVQNDVSDKFLNYESQFDLYVKCPMKYLRYPFDEHECHVRISSANLNSTRMVFNVPRNATWGRNKNSIGYFDVEIIQLSKTELEHVWEGEKWSIAGFKLKLRRKYWKYIFNYYISSALFVIISWVSFLLPPDDANARIALLITTLLVLVTVLNSVIETSPNAREGPTALAFWMFSMLLFIFLSFVCHCISMIKRKKKEVVGRNLKKDMETQLLNTTDPSNLLANLVHAGGNIDTDNKKNTKSKSNLIDFVALAILIILFSVYVTVYIFVYK